LKKDTNEKFLSFLVMQKTMLSEPARHLVVRASASLDSISLSSQTERYKNLVFTASLHDIQHQTDNVKISLSCVLGQGI